MIDLEEMLKTQERHEVTLVNADDWSGLYIDGELIKEDHMIDAWESLKIIQEKTSGFYNLNYIDCDIEWMHEIGNLPEKLEDVKRG